MPSSPLTAILAGMSFSAVPAAASSSHRALGALAILFWLGRAREAREAAVMH